MEIIIQDNGKKYTRAESNIRRVPGWDIEYEGDTWFISDIEIATLWKLS